LIEDWSGFGGLSNGSASSGLRLAIFGVDEGSVTPLKKGASPRLKPVLISLPGGGWYRGSLYDGLQVCAGALGQTHSYSSKYLKKKKGLSRRGWLLVRCRSLSRAMCLVLPAGGVG
jgi:hypothetical protein